MMRKPLKPIAMRRPGAVAKRRQKRQFKRSTAFDAFGTKADKPQIKPITQPVKKEEPKTEPKKDMAAKQGAIKKGAIKPDEDVFKKLSTIIDKDKKPQIRKLPVRKTKKPTAADAISKISKVATSDIKRGLAEHSDNLDRKFQEIEKKVERIKIKKPAKKKAAKKKAIKKTTKKRTTKKTVKKKRKK
ncbi:hypothetical protein GOV09_02545 [Candidatus Woesearchaeota archaeon]|nr:hypothetical protein [Candidatus Woesearchaeota archaeon]